MIDGYVDEVVACQVVAFDEPAGAIHGFGSREHLDPSRLSWTKMSMRNCFWTTALSPVLRELYQGVKDYIGAVYAVLGRGVLVGVVTDAVD